MAIEPRIIWLPSEVCADVFRFLARRTLVRNVQPACSRFHDIAEYKVDTVHVIRRFADFLDGLEHNLPEANLQLQALAANDASLAQHFRLDEELSFEMTRHDNLLRCFAQIYVLCHSLDLFRGCRIHLVLNNHMGFLAYLALLHSVRPFYIQVIYNTTPPQLLPSQLLRVPLVLNCHRLTFFECPQNTLITNSICNWLHHLPDGVEENGDVTRIFNIASRIMPDTCAEIIDSCKKHLLQSESPSDRRTFLLNFHSETEQAPFQINWPPTGEALCLELFRRCDLTRTFCYRLRRCPIVDLDTAHQFYERIFQDPEAFLFRVPVRNGLEPPTLTIG